MTSGCIFCGSSPTTQTHIFRKAWLARIFPSGAPFRHRVERRGEKGFDRRFNKNYFDLCPSVACDPCNSGWMHDVDLAAEPLIERCVLAKEARLFTTGEQKVLARWVTLVALLLEQTAQEPATTEDVRREFRRMQAPPDGAQIWLGVTAGGADGWELNAWPRPVKLDSASFRGHGYFCTFRIQHLVGQAFIPPRTTRMFALNRPDGQFVTQIWPTATTAAPWPPPSELPADDLQGFAEAFLSPES